MVDTHRTTKAIPSSDPHHDVRVIWSGDGKRIISDQRQTTTNKITTPSQTSSQQQQQRPPFRRVIVKGRKQK